MKVLWIYCFALCLYCSSALQGAEAEKIVILGAGPAGLTSSLFAAQANLNPLVIEGDPYEGQIASIYHIENYPGFPEGISGQDLANRIHQQAEMFGARFQSGQAVNVDLQQRPFHILLDDGREIFCESLVIATGASPKWLGLDSEAALIGHGVSASAILDGPKFAGKDVVVVGGGDSAMEQALLLTEYASHVTIVYKGEKFYGVSYLQERIFNNPKISCRFHSTVSAIRGVEEGYVTGVVLTDKTELACEGLFVSNGRKPNTDLFLGQLEMTEVGYIVTKPNSSLTTVKGVFAAGDITHAAYRKVTTSVAAGCMAAVDATKFLAEAKK